MSALATAALVGGGGAAGAVVRHLADAVGARRPGDFPWATLVVNVVGSFVLGVVVGAASAPPADSAVVLLVGTGFCGALTTYGGFAFQVAVLSAGRPARRRTAVAYAVGSLVLAVLAATAGYALASG